MTRTARGLFFCTTALLALAAGCGVEPDGTAATVTQASGGNGGGGSGGGGPAVDTIKVGKHYYVASNGTLLVSASSSDAAAHLYLYTQAGNYVGEVQNGGGGRYGGSVFYIGADPVGLTIDSSSGATLSVPTAPFQL
jgi:hypothetical protein